MNANVLDRLVDTFLNLGHLEFAKSSLSKTRLFVLEGKIKHAIKKFKKSVSARLDKKINLFYFFQEMTVETQQRPDKRSTIQLRPFTSQQSILTGPDGSAKFSFGSGSSCLVSITGPTEASLRDELMDSALVSVRFTPIIGHTGTQHTLYEKLLTDIANHIILTSLFPRTIIQVCFFL
jgi:hypothetical protein